MSKNTMKTTTTKVLTLDELRTQRTAQAVAVFTDYIKSNHNRDQWHREQWQDLLYQDAEKAVFIALRARHEKSGMQFITELQNSAHNDQTARNNRYIAEQITALEEMHESHRKGYTFFNSRANRLTLTDYERALAFTLAQDFKTKADKEQQQINGLYDSLELTLSDRADLVQVALVTMLENEEQGGAIITPNILDLYEAQTIEDLTAEELEQAQATANFRAVINSVGRAINQLATPDALNRTTTKAEPIDLETVTDYLLKYGIQDQDGQLTLEGVKIPHTTKRATASQCYITIEYRDTKTQQGYYKVTHYKTTAPYQYIENYTQDENTENDIAYLKTYNPFVSTYGDIERIEELCNRANLTDRQRAFLTHFANRCRYDGDFKAVKQYAFKKIGITTATNQSTFFNRLKKALNTATKD